MPVRTAWGLACGWSQTAAEITTAALGGKDPLAVEAVDLLMAIVGAEAGAMALRCMAKGALGVGLARRLTAGRWTD